MKIQKTHFLAIGIATAIFALSSGVQAQETKTFNYTESNVSTSATPVTPGAVGNTTNTTNTISSTNNNQSNQTESAAPDLKTVASNIGGFFSNIGSALKSGIQKVGSTTGQVLQSAGEGLQKVSSHDKTSEPMVDNQTSSNEKLVSLGNTNNNNITNTNNTSPTNTISSANPASEAPTTTVGERMNTDFSIAKDKVSSMVTTIRNKVTNTPEKSTKNDRITNTLF